MDNTLVTYIAIIATFILGLICAGVSIYMFKTNKIPHSKKHDSFSVDEPRQAGVLFALFSLLGITASINLFCSLPSISECAPTTLINVFHLILFLAGLSLPSLLVFASIYGFKTKRVFGYINTHPAKPFVKKYVHVISAFMLIAGVSIIIASLLIAQVRSSLIPSLEIPPVLPGVFFIIGVITCFVMSGFMLKMEGHIKRAVYSTKLVKKHKK